ncbi:MAG: InlB B-repeat-containing protein [Gaiellaceae bacterium]
MKTFLRIGIAVAALGLAGAAGGAGTKPTLTVVVSGSGVVTSSPAGINCRPACKIHARKGAKITLTASGNGGSEFSHWSAPCGTSFKCTVKMTGSRVVHAFFKAEPPAPAPAPPPPPPPPPAKAGHYAGTYTDGSFFKFDVQGTSLTNLGFDFNGHCSDGSTIADSGVSITGSFPIGSDGSFSGPITLTFSDASGSATVAGKANATGLASGTLQINLTFNDGTTCTSSGTWTAQDQS